jgi:hypothetical protein
MPLSDQEATDELRFALRRYLAARPAAACTLEMIAHDLRRKGVGADSQTMAEELTYWINTEPPQVKQVNLPHSAFKAWQITSAGRLAHDRGE